MEKSLIDNCKVAYLFGFTVYIIKATSRGASPLKKNPFNGETRVTYKPKFAI
jgi:hypothetical protein